MKGSFIGFFIIVSIFASLFFLPLLFQKTHFNIVNKNSKSEAKVAHKNINIEKDFLSFWEGGKESRKKHSLKSLADGKNYILLNLWASWCPPCLEELPSLEYLNRLLIKSKNQNTKLVTLSVDEKPSDVFQLFKTMDYKPTFLVLHDADGSFSRNLGTTKFPETYLISPKGKIIYKWVGPQNWLSFDIVQKIAKLKID